MTTATILLILACIVIAGCYSGVEMGLYRLNRVRLSLRLSERRRGAKRLDRIVRRPDEFVIMTLVGHNLFVFLAAFLCTNLYEPAWPRHADLLATATLLVPIFIFGEVLPKEIFRRSADLLMYRLAGTLELSRRVLRPPVFLLVQMARFWKLFPRYRTAPAEIEVERHRLSHFFSESAQEGTLSAYQHAMAANIMKLKGLKVERVMIPLASVVSLGADQTLEECRELARVSPYRRFPVVDEHGKLIGLINMLDVIANPPEGSFDLRDYLRRPVVFSRDAYVIDALHLLKRSAQPMGFVEAPGGDILGIVTIKDLVEQITGELAAW